MGKAESEGARKLRTLMVCAGGASLPPIPKRKRSREELAEMEKAFRDRAAEREAQGFPALARMLRSEADRIAKTARSTT